MIEIGRDSRMSLATRRIATTLGGISAILALVWLIRGPLGLQQYSTSILLAGIGFFFLGRVFRTETNSGAGRAAASLLWNLTWGFVGIILSIWILGWVASLQSDVYPTVVSSRVPVLAVGAITAGLSDRHFRPGPHSCCWSHHGRSWSVRRAKARTDPQMDSDPLHRRRR